MSTATRTADPTGAAPASGAVAVDDRPRLVVLDLARASRRFRELREAFPWVDLYYDVSALCHPALLDAVAAAGGGFEASHPAALTALARRGADPARVLCTAVLPSPEDARSAYRAGVRRFVVDGPDGLDRLAGLPADAQVLVRLRPALAPRPAHRASRGILVSEAPAVARLAVSRGVRFGGFSLHLPADATPTEYVSEIARAAGAAADVEAATGRRPELLDLGEGFPGAATLPGQQAELARAIRALVAPVTSGTTILVSVGRAVTAGCITLVGDGIDRDADPALASECIDAGAEVLVLREADRPGLLSRLPLFRTSTTSRHRTVRPALARRTWTPAG